MSAVLHLSRLPARRGVSKYRGKVMGKNAYLAVTSTRELLHDAVYVVSDEMDDAAIVAWLKQELERVDPVKPRHLRIVPKTVTPAVDGPSLSHPEILARIEVARRELEDVDAAALAARYPEGHIMREVCLRLSALLQQRAV